MKKICALLTLLIVFVETHAQPVLTIAGSSTVSVLPGTVFYASGLAITPSSTFTLTNGQLSVSKTSSHTPPNNFISRFYKFSSNTAPFSGIVKFYYNDSELNNLSETGLQVNIYDDSNTWNTVADAANDSINNYVVTTAINNRVLNELTLSSSLGSLALTWGKINAYRNNEQVIIQWKMLQQQNVSHFTVTRSVDGLSWLTVADNISAVNSLNEHQYSLTDNSYLQSRVYYRIRETNADGRISYSKIITVAATQQNDALIIYPNPAQQSFYTNSSLAASVKQIQLYNSAGARVKIWNSVQPSYNIESLPPGIYFIQMQLKNGTTRNFKLNKK